MDARLIDLKKAWASKRNINLENSQIEWIRKWEFDSKEENNIFYNLINKWGIK
jgi:hypothetical protein